MRESIIEGSIILVSEHEGALIGFKIGYPLNDKEFYSWLGGVIPSKRKTGAAKRLLLMQETLVAKSQYDALYVKSMNCFRSMLHMLISNGYDITHVENYGDPEKERINFKKIL
ncbi:GNAT family N-acetyltransferase [Veronia nyctiphanis]|uniref:GNAT family N-acetyltransferase n=1 Tax=Veronia nyctiphanis TaxID=1278244 RepID=A0A4Q0YGW5_9GAMM|nr:GNAT family N-acetyltransferase [Veronia nyctiphanis]RXJ69485.1 GNAT family N-acetyltransferase [Veronia nyctiphanis]